SPVCTGLGLTLTATATGGSGTYVNYVWTKGGVAILGQTSSTLTIASVTALDAGIYGVTIEDNAGCISDEITTAVAVSLLPIPTAGNNGPVCEGGTVN